MLLARLQCGALMHVLGLGLGWLAAAASRRQHTGCVGLAQAVRTSAFTASARHFAWLYVAVPTSLPHFTAAVCSASTKAPPQRLIWVHEVGASNTKRFVLLCPTMDAYPF